MIYIAATMVVLCGAPLGADADYGAFSVSRMQCVIGNNAAAGAHRAGYNGVFQLTAPDASKNAFVPLYAGLAGNVLGVFWASYINAPLDKSIYFLSEGSSLDAPQWAQYCTLKHGRDSTVRGENDAVEIAFEGGSGALFQSVAPLRYSEPFFYGRVDDRVLIFIFAPGPIIRFSHSPTGGGLAESGDAHNPAWDFQLIVPDYEVGKEYGLTMRLVCKPWSGRDDVIEEARQFRASFPGISASG
ncbi:MAG TPA: hypothetical protein ENN65_02845 [Candidatus Hydrogenedentes bacterium]|nr:hypothetical protein [Candidatus Hydrogenedentota bacterium]